MLRAGADMGKAQFAKQSGYPALGIDDAKARLDHPLQVDPPPADNPVHRRIGAGLDNLAKFFHLDIAQVARPARALAVGEAIRSLFVEPVNPVPQGLAIHPTDPCGLSTAHAIVDRRKRQQTAALPGILATAGEFTKVAGIKVATKRNTGWHGDPPLPTLNQIKTDLGIPTESEIDAVGITEHLGYEPHGEPASQQSNRRNGAARKVLKGNDGAVPIDIPRDRDGSFEPELIQKGQTRIDGMDDKIIGLYAAGLSTRDIRAHLEEVYGLRVSADLISRVTDAVLEEVSDWQNRALEPVYPIVFPDALRVKIRDAESRQVKNKAVYVALGVTPEGEREVPGLWIADNEGAKFWLSVMNNLKNRGLEDILIAVVDGLKGFPDAINAAFPDTTVQTCIVHLVRHSLNFCGWKDRKAVAKDLKLIYQAVDDGEAAKALDDFEAEWGDKYPSIAPSWRRAWQEVIPFFAFPPAVRKIIYTTNAIESLNRVIRKTTKTRGSFPTDAAATKLIYLAIRNFEKAGRCVREWVAARNQFAILYPERFNK